MFLSLHDTEHGHCGDNEICDSKKISKPKRFCNPILPVHFSPSLNKNVSYHPWGSVLTTCRKEIFDQWPFLTLSPETIEPFRNLCGQPGFHTAAFNGRFWGVLLVEVVLRCFQLWNPLLCTWEGMGTVVRPVPYPEVSLYTAPLLRMPLLGTI